MMKILLSRRSVVVVGVLSLAALVLTGCPSGEATAEQKTAELKKSARDVWTYDIDGEFKAAAESGKPVLIYFTGSDWCGWC